MNILQIIVVFVATVTMGSARDDIRTQFIKKCILNENKPTFVVFCNLCWKENEKVLLANEISKLGGRVSSSLQKGFNRYQDHEVLFLLDLDCANVERIINMASSTDLFRSPYRWLIMSKPLGNATEDSQLGPLWNSPLLPDSDVVLAERNGIQFVMKELHRPSMNHSITATPRGYYNGSLVDTRPRRELYRRRMDLMGHPLTMSNVIQDSNSTKYHLPREDGLEFQNDAVTKISWMNAKLAFLMLNATPRHVFSYRWGFKVNGQWSGMIQDLHSGRADIGTNCVVSITERLSVVAYTDTLAPLHVRFIFRQPPLSYASNIYSLPFSTQVWVAMAVCAGMSAAVLCVATRWEAGFASDATLLDGSVSDAMFLTMSALSQQGCFMEPRRISGRIMVWVIFTALMTLYAAYSANIVVLLQAPSHSILTLSQLAASKITLAANDVDYNHFIFKHYNDSVHVAIYKMIEPARGRHQFYDINEGVERIRQGLFAFHSISEPVYRRVEQTFLEHEKCDLTEIDYLSSFDPYVPMKKDSPYLELIKVAFKRLRETGVVSALNRRHQTPKPHCSNKASAFSSVGVLDLKPVLLLMAIGVGTAFTILIIEIVVFHLKTKGKRLVMKRNQRNETF